MSARSRVGGAAVPVSDLLPRHALGPRQAQDALALWPLVVPPEVGRFGPPPYLPLADALAGGAVVVDEVHAEGAVPNVLVENRGDAAVLVLFGEELRGAKQNRVANASFLVGPHERVVLDVSCVEHGRWARRAAALAFGASGLVVSSRLRRRMAWQVAASRSHAGRFHADQGDVWDEVRRRVAGTGVESRSFAYADYAASRAPALGALTAAFRPLERQIGFVAAIDGAVAGVEIVGHPEVFARVFAALLHAYAIDAMDAALLGERDAAPPRFTAPEPFLAALAAASGTTAPSLGLGQDLRLAGDGVEGCALLAGDVVHLAAFPV